MRVPVIKAMCFVLANGTVLLAASALADGIGSGHVRSGAEELGAIAFAIGLGGLVAEVLGILPRVQAFVAGAAARHGAAESRPEPSLSGDPLPN